jgi:hypothetical protein
MATWYIPILEVPSTLDKNILKKNAMILDNIANADTVATALNIDFIVHNIVQAVKI